MPGTKTGDGAFKGHLGSYKVASTGRRQYEVCDEDSKTVVRFSNNL